MENTKCDVFEFHHLGGRSKDATQGRQAEGIATPSQREVGPMSVHSVVILKEMETLVQPGHKHPILGSNKEAASSL